MKFSYLVALAMFAATWLAGATARLPTLVGNFSVSNPAFFAIGDNTTNNTLLITSFTGNPFVAGTIYAVPGFDAIWQQGPSAINMTKPAVLLTGLQWPNELSRVEPQFAPDTAAAYLFGDGFLVPGKSNGNLYAMGLDGTSAALAPLRDGYFYHKALQLDVDGDGHVDIITARATKPFFSSGHGELVWLRNPGVGGALPWALQTIVDGPDVITALHPESTADKAFVAACEFFNQQVTLNVLHLGNLTARWVIDNTIGAVEDCTFVDLDGDGLRHELLVTNHVNNQSLSGVFAYTLDLVKEKVLMRYVLAQGEFPTREAGFAQASPGFAYTFYVSDGERRGGGVPPHIALAGDGAQAAYILTPLAGEFFNYTVTQLVDVMGTVGSLGVGDVDGDGFTDLLVPDFDAGYVLAYSYSPV